MSARLDGGQRIGMVCVSQAVDMAIEKATNTGVGIVGVSNYASATGALGKFFRTLLILPVDCTNTNVCV